MKLSLPKVLNVYCTKPFRCPPRNVIQIFMSSAAWDILKLGGEELNFPYHCQVMYIISIS